MDALDRLIETTAQLRHPEVGCPWNIKQTHLSIKRHLLEETYELLEAIDSGVIADIREELGDVLFQVVLHSQIACENNTFSLEEVIKDVNAKMMTRHPHVFGDNNATTQAELDKLWEEVKAKEKASKNTDSSDLTTNNSLFGSIPSCLPSLARATKILKKASKHNINTQEYLDNIRNNLKKKTTTDFLSDISSLSTEEDVAGLLLLLSQRCKDLSLDGEDILRQEVLKLQKYLENMAQLNP